MHGIAGIMLRHTRRKSNEHCPDIESFKMALVTEPDIGLGGRETFLSVSYEMVTMC